MKMRRRDYQPSKYCQHAGLFLERGMHSGTISAENGEVDQQAKAKHSQAVVKHLKEAAQIKVPNFYESAYQRWKTHLAEHGPQCSHWFGELTGRLYLGLGEASPLETSITLHHTYGVPYIPGSAIKGVLHHYALAHGYSQSIIDLIFGEEPQHETASSGNAGHVIFNDAWWLAGKVPALSAEVVTVHHQDYYSNGGDADASDFDDPNPNPHIAIAGSFHFSFFADEKLHDLVNELLQQALQEWGVGGKRSSGYGVFVEDHQAHKAFYTAIENAKQEAAEAQAITEMSTVEKAIYEIEKSEQNPEMFLLQELENNRWESVDDQDIVAKRIRALMRDKKHWKPGYKGGKKALEKRKKICDRVIHFMKNDDN